MPVSYLTCRRGRTPSSAPRSPASPANPGRHTATSESAPSASVELRLGQRAHGQDPGIGKLAPQLDGLGRRRDRQPRAPPASAARAHSTAPCP